MQIKQTNPRRWPLRLAGALVLVWAAMLLAAGPAKQDKLFSQSQFSRYTEDGDRPRLETAVLTLKGKDGFVVDLVSVVHIGDAAYYQGLNQRFKQYDAVLYEMVSATVNPAPPAQGEKHNSAISLLQRGMKAVMGLSFQLDEIDYTRPNFVHADMDAAAFFAAQERRGESFMGLVLKAYMAEMNRPAPATRPAGSVAYKPIDWGHTPESRRRAMKLMLGQVLGDIERQALQLDGPEGSAILTDRNDACLKVLRQQRKAGKKRVAIFFGAAHMPDLADKLVKVDKLAAGDSEWLVAWDIGSAPTTQPTK